MFKGGLGNIMKQAQKMQEDMAKAQAELAEMEVTGSAGGGMVNVVMNGKHGVRGVKVDPSVFEEDRDMLEDLLAAAINDAVQKVEDMTRDHLSGVTQGMGLPPGFKMPF